MVVKLQLASLSETGVGRRPAVGHRHARRRSRPRSSTGFLLIAILPSSVILVGTGAAHRAWPASPSASCSAGGPAAARARVPVGAAGARRRGRCRARRRRAHAVRGGDRLPLRPRGRRPRARLRPGAAARHAPALLRRPRRPDPPRVRVRPRRSRRSPTSCAPAGEPLSALHIGGGGLTVPRYLAEVRPGTESLVIEVDPGVVAIDREQLALETSDRLRVRVADGRVGLAEEPAGSRDLVVGDAFGGLSVPWQLTTREALELVDARPDRRRRLRGQPDRPPAAGLRPRRAGHAAGGLPARRCCWPARRCWRGRTAATSSPSPPARRCRSTRSPRGWPTATSPGRSPRAPSSTRFVGDAPVLTDDYAPVDQLLTPYG